jgi:hypothetical protein
MTKKLAVPRRILRQLSREQLMGLGDFIQELLQSFPREQSRRAKRPTTNNTAARLTGWY